MENESPKKHYSLAVDITIVGIAVLISGTLLIRHADETAVTADTREERYFRPVDTKTDLIYGNPGADLFIVEYGDLECPYCKDFHPNAEKLVESDWGISGKVAWVWRNGFHINRVSVDKARTLDCVRLHTGKQSRTLAWKFIEESLTGGVYEREYPYERYKTIMNRLDIPFEKVEECRKNNETEESLAIAARDVEKLNITETPYLQFISGNGELLFESVGSLTLAQLESFVASIIRNQSE